MLVKDAGQGYYRINTLSGFMAILKDEDDRITRLHDGCFIDNLVSDRECEPITKQEATDLVKAYRESLK